MRKSVDVHQNVVLECVISQKLEKSPLTKWYENWRKILIDPDPDFPNTTSFDWQILDCVSIGDKRV